MLRAKRSKSIRRREPTISNMRRSRAFVRAIDVHPSHPSLQCLCARRKRRTTIANIPSLYRYVSEGDDAGVASEDDDDDDAEVEEEVEEEDDGETAPRKYPSVRIGAR